MREDVFRPDDSDDMEQSELKRRCSDAFDFSTLKYDIDERIEVVRNCTKRQPRGGPRIMWQPFAVQRAYGAAIESVLKRTESEDVLRDTLKMIRIEGKELTQRQQQLMTLESDVDKGTLEIIRDARDELTPLQQELLALQSDVESLKQDWQNWTGPALPSEVDETKGVSEDKEGHRREIITFWTDNVGRFIHAKLRFKGADVEPHGCAPGHFVDMSWRGDKDEDGEADFPIFAPNAGDE